MNQLVNMYMNWKTLKDWGLKDWKLSGLRVQSLYRAWGTEGLDWTVPTLVSIASHINFSSRPASWRLPLMKIPSRAPYLSRKKRRRDSSERRLFIFTLPRSAPLIYYWKLERIGFEVWEETPSVARHSCMAYLMFFNKWGLRVVWQFVIGISIMMDE